MYTCISVYIAILLFCRLETSITVNTKLIFTLGPVTHVYLRQFYNAFVLHRRFITDRLLEIHHLGFLDIKQTSIISVKN